MSLARVVARDGETRSGLSRPGAQLPRRVPAKTDRTSSWQFGRLPGALRAPGSLSDRGEPRVEVEPHAGPSAVRGPERLRANPAQLLEALERALHDPGLRQPGPLLAVHLARGERARQPAGASRVASRAAATRAASVTAA